MTRSTAEKEVEKNFEPYGGEAWRERNERKTILKNGVENGGNF